MNLSNPFFIVSGVVVTILGILAIAIILAILIDVRFLGGELHLVYREDDPSKDQDRKA